MAALTSALPRYRSARSPGRPAVIGVLPGEGIGPEVVAVALEVLTVLTSISGRKFEVRMGGVVGCEAQRLVGKSLTTEAIAFCEALFADSGALFCGAGGARFVYELRSRFDLYCKFTPLRPAVPLRDCGPLRPERLSGVDIVAVRENLGGLYFGQWGRETESSGEARAFHSFDYRQGQVDCIVSAAVRLAGQRRGRLCLVIKREGTPSISALWIERFEHLTSSHALECEVLDIDNAVYQLIADPRRFDVLVSPNMFGDVLADTGSLLLASRGMSFSGNFGDQGQATYQTGHGAAYDLCGSDRANPIGQIMALAMMLQESFDWEEGADLVRAAVHSCLARGFRTADIAGPESQVVGTREIGRLIGLYLREASGNSVSSSESSACVLPSS